MPVYSMSIPNDLYLKLLQEASYKNIAVSKVIVDILKREFLEKVEPIKNNPVKEALRTIEKKREERYINRFQDIFTIKKLLLRVKEQLESEGKEDSYDYRTEAKRMWATGRIIPKKKS